MDYIMLIPPLVFVCVMSFQAGKMSVSSPTEEEMVHRIKKIRLERKLREETGAEVDKEFRV